MPGYEGIRFRGTRVSDRIRSGVRGYQVVDSGYEVSRSGVRGYQIRGTRVLDPGYAGIRSGVRGY